MRTWKQAAALTLSVLLTVSAAFPALAVEKPADMDDATWARLQDNTLEYDEIENLVLYYNPTYRQVVDTIEVQLDPLKTAVADLKDYVQEQRDDARRAKDDGDMMSYKIGMATASAIISFKTGGKGTGNRTENRPGRNKDYQRPDPQNHDFCDRVSGDHVSSDTGFEGTGGYFCGVSPGGL